MTVHTLKNILNGLTANLTIKVYVHGTGSEQNITSVECKQVGDDDPLEVILHVEE